MLFGVEAVPFRITVAFRFLECGIEGKAAVNDLRGEIRGEVENGSALLETLLPIGVIDQLVITDLGITEHRAALDSWQHRENHEAAHHCYRRNRSNAGRVLISTGSGSSSAHTERLGYARTDTDCQAMAVIGSLNRGSAQ